MNIVHADGDARRDSSASLRSTFTTLECRSKTERRRPRDIPKSILQGAFRILPLYAVVVGLTFALTLAVPRLRFSISVLVTDIIFATESGFVA